MKFYRFGSFTAPESTIYDTWNTIAL